MFVDITVVIVWSPKQLLFITTNVVSSNSARARCTQYNFI